MSKLDVNNDRHPSTNSTLAVILTLGFMTCSCLGCALPCGYHFIFPLAIAQPLFFGMGRVKDAPDNVAANDKDRKTTSFQFKTLRPGEQAQGELRVEKAGPVTVVVSYTPFERGNKTRVQVFRKADDKAVNILDDIAGELNHYQREFRAEQPGLFVVRLVNDGPARLQKGAVTFVQR